VVFRALSKAKGMNIIMKNKQLVSIIITGAVIVAVGVTGVVSNVISGKLMANMKREKSVSSSFLGDDLFSDDDLFDGEDLPAKDHIGIINIVGEIGPSDVVSSEDEYNHDMYMEYIEEMEKSKKNKGILLFVNSPGGTVYQSDELYLRLMQYKENTHRPIWAFFADQACSGGYYIAMAADKIYANRNAWTGSIGVIVSLVNCKGLFDKLGIKEIDITSGKNKAMGSVGSELTEEQRQILQSLVDESYDQFVEVVVKGRNMSNSTVRALADGRIYSAKQAKENGLIDEISDIEEAKADFVSQAGLDDDIEFYVPESDMNRDIFDLLFMKAKKILPKSEIDLATDIMENRGSGVLKYYAE
jgi:signal peptide peptidase SppA, 36K type